MNQLELIKYYYFFIITALIKYIKFNILIKIKN